MNLDQIIVSMLSENTGAHMLDSGGAYGRNHERNKGKTLADWRKMPEVTVTADLIDIKPDAQPGTNGARGGYLMATINVFHFLSKTLDSYRATQTRALWRFANSAEYRDSGWLESVDAWLEHIGAEDGEMGGNWINTYNGEDSLSQVLQYRPFSLDGVEYVALQIHGGCDVRGGYTRPRVFELPRYADVSLWDNNKFTVTDGENAWYFDGYKSFEASERNEDNCNLNTVTFTNDAAKRGKGEIYVDDKDIAYSPVNGEPLTGYII